MSGMDSIDFRDVAEDTGGGVGEQEIGRVMIVISPGGERAVTRKLDGIVFKPWSQRRVQSL